MVGPALGRDFSGWQSVEEVAAAAADPNVKFIILKATEGMRTVNSKYAAQRAAAGDKFIGAYHLAWPSQDVSAEAAHFLDVAQLAPGQIAFYDGEDWGETDPTKPNYVRDKAMRDATPWSRRVAFQLDWSSIVGGRQLRVIPYHGWSWIKGLRNGSTLHQWQSLTDFGLWLVEPTGQPGVHSTVTAKDGSNEDDWPILLHQYISGAEDHNYAADFSELLGA